MMDDISGANMIRPGNYKTCLQLRFKPACSATETRWKIEISLVTSVDMMLSNKRITKALIRLRGCAGWSAPLLFANLRRQVFSRRGPIILDSKWMVILLLIRCLLNIDH